MGIAPELAAAMNWRQWEAHVQGLLRFYGWRHFHAPANKPIADRRGRAGRQHVERGFPDLVAIRRLRGHGPELLVAELKTGTGRLSPDQRAWLEDLRAFAGAVDELVTATRPLLERALGFGELTVNDVRGFHRNAPAVGVYVWFPADVDDVERKLAGPHGVNVPVDRVAELAGGEVIDEDQEAYAERVAELARPRPDDDVLCLQCNDGAKACTCGESGRAT